MSKKTVKPLLMMTALVFMLFLGAVRQVTANSLDEFQIEDNVLVRYIGSNSVVDIPEGVKGIGDSAFANTGVGKITIPPSVTYIGFCAFAACHSLDTVNINAPITSIGEGAFGGCDDLREIYIPDSVKTIGRATFYNCKRLWKIHLPDSLTSIEGDTFHSCQSLSQISIPDSVTSIDYTAFQNTSLKKIKLPPSLKSISYEAFMGCSLLEEVNIPNSVKSIGEGAFKECKALKKIKIPDSVKTIGKEAFWGCESLKTVTLPKSLTAIKEFTFERCIHLQSIKIPKSVKTIGAFAFDYCIELDIPLPDSVKSIGDGAFRGCMNLGYSVCRTSEGAPDYCYTIPDSVTSIGIGAFVDCTALVKVKIPKSVKQIGEYAFGFYHPKKKNGKEKISSFSILGHMPSEAWDYALSFDVSFENADAIKISDCKISVKDQIYTGKLLTPKVTVMYGNKKLKAPENYVYIYKNNRAIGTASVVITGLLSCKGKVEAHFTISPKKMSISRLTTGKKCMTVKWKKQSGITGYEVQYSQKKNFSGAKKKVIKKAKTTGIKIKNLKGGKLYFVQVRSYKVVNNKYYYSAWSKKKAIKVKK